MATNILNEGSGHTIRVTLGATVVAGQPTLLGDQGLWGWAIDSGVSGDVISVLLSQGTMVSYPVTGDSGAPAAIAIYDKVYWGTGDAFMDVTTSNTLVGWTLKAVGSGATATVQVWTVLGGA